MSKLSIVIITLNESDNIGNILNDLKNQTIQDFEVIVSDSGSDDNTVEIAETYRNEFMEFNIVVAKERGIALARNTGAATAKHERLVFFDSDSRINPNFLEKVLNIVEPKKIDVAAVYMDMNDDKLANRLTAIVINFGFWIAKFIFPAGSGGCMISTMSAHEEFGGFNIELDIAEDCEYALKAHKHKKFTYKMIPVTYKCDMRRFEDEGHLKLLNKWGSASIRRFFKGEYTNNTIEYKYGHFKKK